MNFQQRIATFTEAMDGAADIAFFPISADLQYLTGIPRDIPNYGAVLHPGGWLEGAWIRPGYNAVLTLTRMSAEFGNLAGSQNVDVRVLGEHDNPSELVRGLLDEFNLPENPRVAIGDHAGGETIVGIQKLLPDATFSSGTALLNPQRAVKGADEIEAMRKAGEVTEAAFAAVLPQLKIGMTELDIIAEVDSQLKKHGALGPSFTTSLYNSGPNHPLMFGQRLETWPRVLTAPVSVLFDFGAAMPDGFCYDFGRTVSFGEPDDEQQRVYDLVMASQRAGIAALKAGEVTCADVDADARAVIEEGGYGAEFRHRLGHGIGMDVHEAPFLTKTDHTPVAEGMMFTIEPSITQMETFSARVEDVVVARPGGGEALTTGYQELIVVEA
ncbi:MAG: Xaa-Pro peptidase family protein [Chloroflexota bacterium]